MRSPHGIPASYSSKERSNLKKMGDEPTHIIRHQTAALPYTHTRWLLSYDPASQYGISSLEGRQLEQLLVYISFTAIGAAGAMNGDAVLYNFDVGALT